MRSTYVAALVVGLVVTAARPALAGQRTSATGPVPLVEAVELTSLVDRVAAGQPAGGDAWLKWSGHFLRAADGRVQVKFTVALDEASDGFESIAMYVRVAPRDARNTAGPSRVRGSDLATPVSAPERQFARGNPTAGEASARLGLLAAELGATTRPFEGYFVGRMPSRPAPLVLRRSFVVAPGDYDLYVAIRERAKTGTRATPKQAALHQALTVPDLGGRELSMSSIILADRIEPVATRLSASQEAERPYAFGSAEVFPKATATFAIDDTLVVVLFAYNLAVDDTNLPDATVRYRFRQMSQFDEVFGELPPQRLGRGHAAPVFDRKAGRQLAVTQALPLATFPPDTYELEVVVTDNLSGRSVQRITRFAVGPR
jgi:hypothetical protein